MDGSGHGPTDNYWYNMLIRSLADKPAREMPSPELVAKFIDALCERPEPKRLDQVLDSRD